ncbi:Zn(II)2Cys6 transcription factor [Aspergillus brunneoviolaceus CBS 621.78]|uniref:Uncharacterized protein n=1 Tax=Aspergillus brunneoviolaceus CBS 621.78 TaxID=1450534 RepID=A0ACD1GFR8_9EURO|nr:hypothetical protein BO95DRAFT_480622 [Aspergillus brunneoviolaceus CBS 621.78]RAH47926.1 hypothetical protein BO95DRAFT_480622 [Aspergillus brunneoviolaceus CBS 621.78]
MSPRSQDATAPTPAKKCDGGIPACSNCARAKESCVDVDGRNNDISIPRDYAVRCHARIEWLEEQLLLLDPDFDLSKAPPVDQSALPNTIPRRTPSTTPTGSTAVHLPSAPGESNTRKRPFDSLHASDCELLPQTPAHLPGTEHAELPASCVQQAAEKEAATPSAEARSVAMDLGMLSLHSDSRQKYYLGSSSGLFFTKLIGADSPLSPATSNSSYGAWGNLKRRTAPGPSPEAYRLLYNKLRRALAEHSQDLPSPDEANHLIGIYLQELHVDHPFLHTTSLFNAYNALWFCAERGYQGNVDLNGWPEEMEPFSYNGRFDQMADANMTPISIFAAALHVFMVLSLAATILTRNKNFEYPPARFYAIASTAAAECLSGISVTALQSILLFIVQGMVGPTTLSIWTLVHIAMSHAIDLGLHREPKDEADNSPTALALRRLIFYTVYNLDRSISTIQGRPLGIRDETFDIRLPGLNEFVVDETASTNANSHSELRFSIHRFKLDALISEIKILLYHLPNRGTALSWPTDTAGEQARIKTGLDQWLADVRATRAPSEELTTTTTTTSLHHDEDHILKHQCKILKLEVLYHGAITLLYQPSQAFPSPTAAALLHCYRSSRDRIHIYNRLNTQEHLYYTWRNIHGIFASGATIIYCFWASPELQAVVPFKEALQCLRVCSNLLSIGGQWWPSVRHGKENFDRIVDLTVERLSQKHHHHHHQQLQLHQLSATGANTLLDPTTSAVDDGLFQPAYPPVPTDGVTPNMQQQQQEAVENLLGLSSVACDAGLGGGQDLEMTAQHDPILESFFTEYLQGDWSWDPFSTGLEPLP